MIIIVYILLVLSFAEISCRYWLKFQSFKVARVNKLSQSSQSSQKEDKESTESIKPYNGITSISVLTLRQFIQCICYGNLSVLGEGTPEQLQDAFNDLLSQYYEAKKDEGAKQRVECVAKMKEIEMHAFLLNSLNEILQERYSEAACEILRKLYPKYQFSYESLANDLKTVKTLEIKNAITYDRYKKALDEMGGNGKAATEQDLIKTLLSISKFQGASYNQEMTVMEFAVAQNMIMEHIEDLEIQNAKQ